MSTTTKARLIEQARDAGIEVEERGGGWFVVAGQNVRGLDALEEAIDDAINGPDETSCLCGCGQPVARRFAQGHDAKLKSVLLKVARHEMGAPAIPDVALPHLEELGSLLGQHDDVDIEDVLEVVNA